MTLLDTIKERLDHTSHDEVIRKMGYINIKTGRRSLENFLASGGIQSWLERGCFDMHHSSSSFLLALVEALELPVDEARKEIDKHSHRKEQIRSMKNVYIFVDTGFKRRGEPIFLLAMAESLRHIKIDKAFCLDHSKEEILQHISETVKAHYEANNGKLAVWGEIQRYVYQDAEGNETYYSVEGEILEDAPEVKENSASLRVGNQVIAGVEK
jgi:hypothetical protein